MASLSNATASRCTASATSTTFSHRDQRPWCHPGRRRCSTRIRISCSSTDGGGEKERKISSTADGGAGTMFDRRDVLIGLGAGLYGVTGVGFSTPTAAGAPIVPPDLCECEKPNLPAGAVPTTCCTPYHRNTIVNFKLPDERSPMRVRRPAHLVDDDYVAKYERGIALMKALPGDDPRSFTNQANLHCAYCNGVYEQMGFPDLEYRPTPFKPKAAGAAAAKSSTNMAMKAATPTVTKFPVDLNKVVKVVVNRPRKSRTTKEKEEEEEVLLVDGIEFDGGVAVKFDVYVNLEDETMGKPTATKFVGSFVNVPSTSKKIKTRMRMGITELLEDIDADDDDDVVVTLVPRLGKDVSVGGVEIEYDS